LSSSSCSEAFVISLILENTPMLHISFGLLLFFFVIRDFGAEFFDFFPHRFFLDVLHHIVQLAAALLCMALRPGGLRIFAFVFMTLMRRSPAVSLRSAVMLLGTLP